jgi:predicted DNA-binding transcriptional regulator AlpA
VRRMIDASEKDWLTLAEVAQQLTVSESTVKDLVRTKRFPPPVRIAHRAARWHWLDPIAYAHLTSRLPVTVEEPESSKFSGGEEGQGRTRKGRDG